MAAADTPSPSPFKVIEADLMAAGFTPFRDSTELMDELAALGRHGILSVEEQESAAANSIKASFVKGAIKVAVPRSAGTSPRTLKEEV